jgi:hypothetical protein
MHLLDIKGFGNEGETVEVAVLWGEKNSISEI